MGIETGQVEIPNNKKSFIIDNKPKEVIASADYDDEKVQAVTFEMYWHSLIKRT